MKDRNVRLGIIKEILMVDQREAASIFLSLLSLLSLQKTEKSGSRKRTLTEMNS